MTFNQFFALIGRIIIVCIFFTIFLGIPYLAGSWIWMIISWVPAAVTVSYLDDTFDR